jgi:cytochrome b
LFHWIVVILVATAYVTSRLNRMVWHERAGYAVLTLVFFRLLWGFFGSETARFSRFLVSPRAAFRYLGHVLRREADRQAGHNPAGGWMVMLLLLLLLAESLTGMYVANDVADEGRFTELMPSPVANAITALHSALWWTLLAAVALHIAAVLVYAAAKGQNLLRPMITGYKSLPVDVPRPQMASMALAAVLLGCSAIAAALLAYAL